MLNKTRLLDKIEAIESEIYEELGACILNDEVELKDKIVSWTGVYSGIDNAIEEACNEISENNSRWDQLITSYQDLWETDDIDIKEIRQDVKEICRDPYVYPYLKMLAGLKTCYCLVLYFDLLKNYDPACHVLEWGELLDRFAKCNDREKYFTVYRDICETWAAEMLTGKKAA